MPRKVNKDSRHANPKGPPLRMVRMRIGRRMNAVIKRLMINYLG
jgi:hypothetical protein